MQALKGKSQQKKETHINELQRAKQLVQYFEIHYIGNSFTNCEFIVSKLRFVQAARTTLSYFSGKGTKLLWKAVWVCFIARFPASSPGLQADVIIKAQRVLPPTKKSRPTCSCMQALERMRRSSLRQLDITLAMATGLVAYFTCGATRQGKFAKEPKARSFSAGWRQKWNLLIA